MTRTARRSRTWLCLPIGLALLAAACGGGGDDSADTTAAPSTTKAPTTSTSKAPTTTTTATTAAPDTTTATTAAPETTTTAAPAPTWPLTGLPAPTDPADLAPLRRALVVKIENTPPAVPQNGLAQADIVYEENVEGVTRFAAVFHSQGSDPVGPVRSGRTQDVNLLTSLNHPLFLWSGGNRGVTQMINESELVNLSPSTANGPAGFYRERSRKAPHNLYASTTKAWEASPEGFFPASAQFTFRTDGSPLAGLPGPTAQLSMEGGLNVRWDFDPASGRYFRSQRGKPHNDAGGDQLSAMNVVVLYVEYVPSPVDRNSPDAQTTGEGDAWIFSNGNVAKVKWSRADEHSPWVFKDESGNPVSLTPGNTWVELARDGALSFG